jgi:hypothetical protein
MRNISYSTFEGNEHDPLTIDRDDALHRSASKIIQQVRESLQNCKLQISQHRRLRMAGEVSNNTQLSTTWELLDTEVVSPLEELQQRLDLTVSIVRDVYEAQVLMLTGGKPDMSTGLRSQVLQLKEKQKDITSRLQKISSTLDAEMSVCAELLAYTNYKARGLTTGERKYVAELRKWESVAIGLEAAVDRLGNQKVLVYLFYKRLNY